MLWELSFFGFEILLLLFKHLHLCILHPFFSCLPKNFGLGTGSHMLARLLSTSWAHAIFYHRHYGAIPSCHTDPLDFFLIWRVLYFLDISWSKWYMVLSLGINFKLFLQQFSVAQAGLITDPSTVLRMSLATGSFHSTPISPLHACRKQSQCSITVFVMEIRC